MPMKRESFAYAMTPGAGNDAGVDHATSRHSHVGKKGDLIVELHYGDFDTGHGRQAALFIRRADPRKGVFIPLSTMWQYAEHDAIHLMIPPLAEQLYGFVTKDDIFRIMDAVMDYLGDLRKSPPDPDLYKDKSLDAFMEGCAQEGLDFFVEVNGKRTVG